MKTLRNKKRRLSFRRWAVIFVGMLLLLLPFGKTANGGGRYGVSASAKTDALNSSTYSATMSIEKYTAEFTVLKSRKIEINQKVTVRFLRNQRMFYLALPLEGDRYYGFDVKCYDETGAGNPDFSWYIADNPDVSGFLDVNCKGGVNAGNTWTYEFDYMMEIGKDDVKNGMQLDVVGFGSSVPINDVTVTVHLPAAPRSAEYISGAYGSSGHGSVTERWTDEKTWVLTSDCLPLSYSSAYRETVAEGIYLSFSFEKGVLADFTTTRIFTDDLWQILLLGGVGVGLCVGLLFLTKKKKEMITVVNIKAPDEMDPMKMGKWLDGNVDNEDVTSMIYYFAHKGYLVINLENEDDPLLIRKIAGLPVDAPVYQRTLFNGLFKAGDAVRVSQLEEKYYMSVETAKKQLLLPKMYDKKSVLGFALCGVLGMLFVALAPLFTALFKIGGGYTSFTGFLFIVPVLILMGLGFVKESYRYKWKKKTHNLVFLAQIAVSVLATILYTVLMKKHLMLASEKVLVCLFSCAFVLIGCTALSRNEKYTETLGQILGFKDFIVVTEEEKIKVMLEENPELYYKILPYAQVLGVTQEWEDKFRNILIEPPYWCVGARMTVFDYMILNRCMRLATVRMMTRPRPKSSGGYIGRSGGGGSFGGFGGGGHGGGGFGTR